MNSRKLSLWNAVLLSAVLIPCLYGADVPLMKNGTPQCTVIVSAKAGPVEKHAAKELAVFLGKISAGTAPAVASQTIKGTLPIRFELTKDQRVAEEGFMIRTGKDRIVIYGQQPIGFLYGTYYLLKKYGGIRWLFPGNDGEYFTVKKNIAVPEGEYISNPSYTFRNINWACAGIFSPKWGSFDWMVRNGLRIFEPSLIIQHPDLYNGLLERGAVAQDGGHTFSQLLTGLDGDPKIKGWKEHIEELKRLYKEHPEYFPLINGKRTFLEGQKYQPCTSNPEVIRIMSGNLIGSLKKGCAVTPGGRYRLVNNDGTGWCECPNCKKIDGNDPGMTTRYWTFMNRLAEEVFKEVPDAIINTIAYQNYQSPPETVMPDKRFKTIELSFNRICYRHAIDDPDCPTNRGNYLPKHEAWTRLAKKQGYDLVTYGQIDALGEAGMPIDEVFLHDVKYYYEKLGIRGIRPQLAPPDGNYGKNYDSLPMVKLQWNAMWQVHYCWAQLVWDINADIDKIYEESGALYYGKAWNNGMRNYRKLLNKSFRETPGCYGWGHSSPLGRCLDQAGVHQQLLSYLDEAEKAAAQDPDKRALAHVKMERNIFELTWEKHREAYLKNFREVKSYHRQSPIVIDGVLDEADWKNADATSSFKLIDLSGKPAKYQTYVKVVHEPDFLYFGIEALEPDPQNIICGIKKHDNAVWTDDTVELFLNYPDLAGAYYQIIINAKGVVFDQFVQPGSPGKVSFESGIEVKTKLLKDRWIIEAKISTGPIGAKCFDGEAWKINVLRSRKGTAAADPESSTWSLGMPHSVDAFLPVNFCARRNTEDGSERDTRDWRNGSLNELNKKKFLKWGDNWIIHDGLLPANWYPCGATGELSVNQFAPDKTDNRYVDLRGILANDYTGKAPFVAVNVRVKGKGKLRLSWYCYDEVEKRRIHRLSRQFGEKDISADNWETVRFETDVPKYDITKLALEAIPASGEKILLDSVYVSPIEKRSGK